MSSDNGFKDRIEAELRREEEFARRATKIADHEFSEDWHEDYSNVTGLGDHLVREEGYRAEELQAYYEEPWHFRSEYWDFLFFNAIHEVKGIR